MDGTLVVKRAQDFMVRRRKQLKPSGGDKNPYESTMTMNSCLDTRSPLVALPVEIQGIITSHLVQFRDLNHLCCTCKTLSAVVLPILYHTIELKIPLQWSRLPSLEKLLASSSEGLKHTRCLKIVTAQSRQGDNTYRDLDEILKTDDEEVIENEQEFGYEEEVFHVDEVGEEEPNRLFRAYYPKASASSALNAFIRVLAVKLPPQQLHTFCLTPGFMRSRWDHACSLDTLTLSIVLKHHGASIHTLNFRQFTETWRKADVARLTIGGLKTLGIAELHNGGQWVTELLARNYQNLRHLRLGNEVLLAMAYALDGYLETDEVNRSVKTETFAELMKEKFRAFNEPSTPVVQLESLSLIGLNFRAFIEGLIEPFFNFSSLTVLTLESCVGLEAAFPLLVGAVGKRKAKSALRLHTLAIRHENASHEFLQKLETFLFSLKPLDHLHVLLEGDYGGTVNLGKVLRKHGKCLQSCIWDERTMPRSNVHEDTAFLPGHAYLELFANHCPGLKALGIAIDWKDIAASENNKKKVKAIASSFSRLSQLQTLNIRNLPAATTSETWLPNDYMMEGLATMLLNIVTQKARIEQIPALKTLAIGASTYSNIREGTSHYTPNDASTFLQLRIYHVNYDCRYRNSLSPKLHLIARGTPADAWGNAENLDIFTLYWLDGAPRDPETDDDTSVSSP
ncbi:MAG: hypothetical protein Q9161_001399 [Pseudevernia consocians]